MDSFHQRLFKVTEQNATMIAKTIIKAKWGIKSPPPWLVCAILHVPYYPPMDDVK